MHLYKFPNEFPTKFIINQKHITKLFLNKYLLAFSHTVQPITNLTSTLINTFSLKKKYQIFLFVDLFVALFCFLRNYYLNKQLIGIFSYKTWLPNLIFVNKISWLPYFRVKEWKIKIRNELANKLRSSGNAHMFYEHK